MASSDLEGLGPTEGPPATYSCVSGNILPRLLPWLAILVLLSAKPNRSLKAWWIWLPLAGLAGAAGGALDSLSGISSETRDAFCLIVNALGFGLAAVWLLAPFLKGRTRVRTWLRLLLALAGSSLVTYGVQEGLDGDPARKVRYLICLAVLALILSVSVALAGYRCRRGYQGLRFAGWLLGWLLLTCALALAPFVTAAWMSSNRSIRVVDFLVPLLFAVGIAFGAVVPFLILSAGNSLFAARLKQLLHLEEGGKL